MEEKEKSIFETDSEAYMMLNAMIRIAKDLEKVLIALWMSAGLLGLIAFMIVLRTMLGR